MKKMCALDKVNYGPSNNVLSPSHLGSHASALHVLTPFIIHSTQSFLEVEI